MSNFEKRIKMASSSVACVSSLQGKCLLNTNKYRYKYK